MVLKVLRKDKSGIKKILKTFIVGLNVMSVREDLALPIIISFNKPKAIEFRKELGFNQHDLIMTKQ